MKGWAIIAQNGRISRLGTGSEVPAGAIELPEQVILGRKAGDLYVDGGLLLARPQAPPAQEIVTGVAVTGAAGAELLSARGGHDHQTLTAPVIAGEANLDLPPGVWDVTVSGPWPMKASERRVVRGAEALFGELAGVRQNAIGRVNATIGRTRLRFVTDIPSQEMIYLEKRAEALRYLATDPEPETLADFPLIAAEIGITAPTAWQLAQIWVNQSALLVAVAAQLETLRLGTAAAIEAATTAAEIEAAEAAFLQALGEEL